MSVPLSQAWTVATYVLGQRLRGVKRYPLVLMLEPLFRCNLACAGCGKIQFPAEILRRQLTPEQCFAAADECGAPIVSIPGGEPLLHPQIDQIVGRPRRSGESSSISAPTPSSWKSLCPVSRRRSIWPSPFTWTARATSTTWPSAAQGPTTSPSQAIRAARARGFRVTTNTTLFAGADPAADAQLLRRDDGTSASKE